MHFIIIVIIIKYGHFGNQQTMAAAQLGLEVFIVQFTPSKGWCERVTDSLVYKYGISSMFRGALH